MRLLYRRAAGSLGELGLILIGWGIALHDFLSEPFDKAALARKKKALRDAQNVIDMRARR